MNLKLFLNLTRDASRKIPLRLVLGRLVIETVEGIIVLSLLAKDWHRKVHRFKNIARERMNQRFREEEL